MVINQFKYVKKSYLCHRLCPTAHALLSCCTHPLSRSSTEHVYKHKERARATAESVQDGRVDRVATSRSIASEFSSRLHLVRFGPASPLTALFIVSVDRRSRVHFSTRAVFCSVCTVLLCACVYVFVYVSCHVAFKSLIYTHIRAY